MKLTVIGAGSSYTPEFINGLIEHHPALPFAEVCLMDIDEQRLEVLFGFTQRMLTHAGLDISITSTTDRKEALRDATFVNCMIRVGGMDARLLDETIPLRHGVVGQETTGPGGMMKALRSIPVILDLANEMAEICPQAWLVNYTNPSGIIAEALGKHSQVRFVGLCNGPKIWIEQILRLMDVGPDRANIDWIGLNHLSFATRVWVDGKDATEQAVKAVADHWSIDAEWLGTLGVIPASYLRYYYHHDAVVEEARQPNFLTRAERVKQIEAELLRQYADPALTQKPELLDQRGGEGYAALAFAVMRAIHSNSGERHITQAINRGAVDGIPDDASVEVPCSVDQLGVHPIRMGEIPLPVRGLVQAVKAHESLTVEAAVKRSPRIAMQALMAHPLTPGWEVAKPLFDELMAANKPWLEWA